MAAAAMLEIQVNAIKWAISSDGQNLTRTDAVFLVVVRWSLLFYCKLHKTRMNFL
jgi:hypothetical protein